MYLTYLSINQSPTPLHLLLLTYVINMVQSEIALLPHKRPSNFTEIWPPKWTATGTKIRVNSCKYDHPDDVRSAALVDFSCTNNVIKFLDLRQKKLRRIRIHAKNLRHLYLDHNYITKLTRRDLFTPNLKVLTISGNPLKLVSMDIFNVISGMAKKRRTFPTVNKSKWTKRCIPDRRVVNVTRKLCKCLLKYRRTFQYAQLCMRTFKHKLSFINKRVYKRKQTRLLRLKRSTNDTTTPPPYKSRYTMPYDPMTGIKTAVTLSAMLVIFFLCVVYYKAKRHTKRYLESWRDKRTLKQRRALNISSAEDLPRSIDRQIPEPVPRSERRDRNVNLTHIRKLDDSDGEEAPPLPPPHQDRPRRMLSSIEVSPDDLDLEDSPAPERKRRGVRLSGARNVDDTTTAFQIEQQYAEPICDCPLHSINLTQLREIEETRL